MIDKYEKLYSLQEQLGFQPLKMVQKITGSVFKNEQKKLLFDEVNNLISDIEVKNKIELNEALALLALKHQSEDEERLRLLSTNEILNREDKDKLIIIKARDEGKELYEKKYINDLERRLMTMEYHVLCRTKQVEALEKYPTII